MSKDFTISPLEAPLQATSELHFNPRRDILAIASYDKSVRILEVSNQGRETSLLYTYEHIKGVLCCKWNPDGSRLASGDASGVLKIYDLGTNQIMEINGHTKGISGVHWASPNSPIVVTASWDKTLKYWDISKNICIGTVELPGKCYALDVNFPLMVVGTSGRHILMFDLNNPLTPYRKTFSPLKWQTRSIACISKPHFAYVLGTLEGRAAFCTVDPKDMKLDFTFKCHRENDKPYSVNVVAGHPTITNAIVTGGGDKSFNFWDVIGRKGLSSHPGLSGQVIAGSFSHRGDMFAYAIGFDFADEVPGRTYDFRGLIRSK